MEKMKVALVSIRDGKMGYPAQCGMQFIIGGPKKLEFNSSL